MLFQVTHSRINNWLLDQPNIEQPDKEEDLESDTSSEGKCLF